MSGVIKIAGVEFYDSSQKIIITYEASTNLLKLSDREYRYDQLESYEYVENQGTIAKGGGVGRALVGGALFGNVGAVVGASTAKRSMDTVIRDMDVRMTFRVNGVLKTEKVTLNQYSNKIKYGSMTYERYLDKAKQLIDKLDQINQQMNSVTAPIVPPENHTVQPAIDMKAKLLELKDLYEQGLLDEEEYKEEKKALLESQRNVPQTISSVVEVQTAITTESPEMLPVTEADNGDKLKQECFNSPDMVLTDGMPYTRQSLEIIDIDIAKDISWRQKLKDSFDLAIKIIGDSQEKAWRNMTGSCPNTFEYIMESIQEDIIKGIASLAKENKSVATKDSNTKLFDIANRKLASYMMNDTLVMVEDEGLIGHDFKSGFAIGYDKVYIARNTKKGEIYTMPFKNIEKLRPNEGNGKFDIDKWFINSGSDYELNCIGITRAKDIALIIGLIIIRSYIANGSEYILKIDH